MLRSCVSQPSRRSAGQHHRKVHPDGTGALKKRPSIHRQVARGMEHQDSYGCRGMLERP